MKGSRTNQITFKLGKIYLGIDLVVVHDEIPAKDIDVAYILEKTFVFALGNIFPIIRPKKFTYWDCRHSRPPELVGLRRPSPSDASTAFAYQVARMSI
jgi:hypothetical protein